MSTHIQLLRLWKNLGDWHCEAMSLSYLLLKPLVLVMVFDVELTDTSESFGLPATADLMFALISTEELEELGQILVKQLKNRYNDINMYKRFVVGIDRSKMRLYDCEQSAQDDILSNKDEEYEYEEKPKKTFEGVQVLMLELNKKLDVEFEDFHGSRIYYIPDFYKDPDEIKEILNLVEPEYFKGDQNGAYNRVHFHDMRHNIPCSNIGFVNKVLSNLCEQVPYEEVSIQTNCHKFVKNEFNNYENYYWWPHQDTGYVGLVYFNRDDDECGTNLYEVLDPEEPEKKRWVQEHTEPWRDKRSIEF